MSTKLIINKFEDGANFKTLKVTIFDEDENSVETKFSEWLDGTSQQKQKDRDKSSRLIVKIVSGVDLNKFNLNSCAREVYNVDKYFNMSSKSLGLLSPCERLNSRHINLYQHNSIEDNIGKEKPSDKLRFDYDFGDTNERSLTTSHVSQNKGNGSYNSRCTEFLNPLEHSLEKVKQNNAHIMENIHMLNRTLNYTKKKEILDVMCPKSMRSYPCNTCGKCFVYETGLRRHYSMRHASTDMQPRWQVVWTCIQCFQVWPRKDQAMAHSSECCNSENPDCIREIKTSSLLQCEYCEKVFTSIPRLIRHFKTHTTTNNYECNACGLAFISYKSAEQHSFICPWLKMYYCFSLPKLLLCNACDRKFRNYDQLYNHRYKVGHFMMKTHCNEGNTKSGGILVYQCEICAQWWPSVPQLKVHRSQYHQSAYHETGIQLNIDNNLRQEFYTSLENVFSVNQVEDIDREC